MSFVALLSRLPALVVWALLVTACGGNDATVPSPTTSETPGPCVSGGAATITVPDVVGEGLPDAIEQVEAAGLSVVDTGTPAGDPTNDTAVVRSQEPPAGHQVPRGACVGFRTEEPTPADPG